MKKQTNARLTYADYTPAQHTEINELILMCSEMDNSDIDSLGAILKTSLISGNLHTADTTVLLKTDPYLMTIIAGGLQKGIIEFTLTLNHPPIPMRKIFDALLHYKKLVLSDYLKHREAIAKLTTHKPLVAAMLSSYSQLPPNRPIQPLGV